MKILTFRRYQHCTKIRLMLEIFGTDNGLKILQYMASVGWAPQLLYDDNGKWTVSLEGGQGGCDPPFIIEHFIDEECEWFENPEEAIWWCAIKNDFQKKMLETLREYPTRYK
jgi:hypothetical protein